MVKPGAGSVFIVALLGLVVVGSAVSVWAAFPRWEPRAIPGFLLVFVAPSGLPATLVGAIFATSRLDRPPRSGTVGAWLRLGAVTGIVLGVLGALAWFGPINAWRGTGLAAALASIAGIGGICGLLVGIAVGGWCARISRRA